MSAIGDKTRYGSTEDRPWEALPAELADVLRRDMPTIYGEVIEVMGAAIPAYERPLEGEFGRNVRRGIDHGFEVFLDLIAGTGEIEPEPYRRLGRIEFRAGRSLDALQAMYRLAGRVAWHHLSKTATANGFDGDVLRVLAEALFAYVDRLTQASVEGYAEAQALSGGDIAAARRKLFDLLVEGDATPEQLALAAREARWRLPAQMAALVLDVGDLKPVSTRLAGEPLAGTVHGLGCLLVPDPAGPGRADTVRAALAGATAVLGPAAEPAAVNHSLQWAQETWHLVAAGDLEAASPLPVDDALAPLLLRSDRRLIERIVEHRLAPLRELRPAARERLAETLLSWLRQRGDRRAIAEELHIHVQTVRYRLTQLRELFGSQLDCPEARFELEIALRSQLASQRHL
jgi:hypothetical protein